MISKYEISNKNNYEIYEKEIYIYIYICTYTYIYI